MTAHHLPLYTGTGGSWSPHVPHLDALIDARLHKRAIKGRRTGPSSRHASPRQHQAQNYARGGSLEHVFRLSWEKGTLLTFIPHAADAILLLESHCTDLFWSGHSCPYLQDAQGDINTLETYLSLKRGRAAISRHIDSFLDSLATPCEHVLAPDTDPRDLLDGHSGEVWLTGKTTLHPLS